MTVSQLIDRLKSYPQDAKIFFPSKAHKDDYREVSQLSWNEKTILAKVQGVYLE